MVENAAKRLRLRFLEMGHIQEDDHLNLPSTERFYFHESEHRMLATTDASSASLQNPVMCVAAGNSMVFTITDPLHYPVYLKDSVMNSNANFDYGAFLILADQMNTKAANNVTTPSLFTFTFQSAGSYVFADSSNSA